MPIPSIRTVSILLAVAACCAGIHAQCLLQSFTADGEPPPTAVGSVISFAGDLLVATAAGDTDPLGKGIFVWRRSSGAWALETKIYPVPISGTFGIDDVDTDGDTVVIQHGGWLEVFEHDAGGWHLQNLLPHLPDSFTGHPEVEGDRIACGVGPFPLATKVVVLEHVADEWVEAASLVPHPAPVYSGGLALRGDTLVVGEAVDSTSGPSAGAAYVFRFDGAAWSKEATLLGDKAHGYFGTGVAVDGDDIVIGAPGLGFNAGYARFFRRNSGVWQEVLTWTDPGADVGSDIGRRVAVQAGLAVVGMRGDDGSASNSGGVEAFRKDASGWTPVATLADSAGAQSAQLGWDVALDGESVVASAFGAAGTVPTQGRLYAFGGIPGSAAFADLGGVLAGVATPCLVGDGQPAAGATVRWTVAHAPTGAPAWFVAGGQLLGLPFKGGTLVPQPDLVLPGFAAGAEGLFELAGPWPASIQLGSVVLLQAWIADPSGPYGYVASNGLQVTAH